MTQQIEVGHLKAYEQQIKNRDGFNGGLRPTGQGGVWYDGFYDSISRRLLGNPERRANSALNRAKHGNEQQLAKLFNEAIVDNVEGSVVKNSNKWYVRGLKAVVSMIPTIKAVLDIPVIARYAADGRAREALAATVIGLVDLNPIPTPGVSGFLFEPAFKKNSRQSQYYGLLGMEEVLDSERSSSREKAAVVRAVAAGLERDEKIDPLRNALSHDLLARAGITLMHSGGSYEGIDQRREEIIKKGHGLDVKIDQAAAALAQVPEIKLGFGNAILRTILPHSHAATKRSWQLHFDAKRKYLQHEIAQARYQQNTIVLEAAMLDTMKRIVQKSTSYSEQHRDIWQTRRGR